jgi:hypothetical protein
MHVRTLVATVIVAASATLAACSSDNVLGLGVAGGGTNTDTLSNARIRFANATTSSFDVATGGAVGAGNAALGFGSASACISTNATIPNIAIRLAGSTTAVPGFTTAYQSGVSYTVIAYTGATGTTLFATIADTFTPASDQSAVRAFNASGTSSSYDVYVTAPGASLASVAPTFLGVTAGTNSGFLGVSTTTAQQVRITSAGSKIVLLDLGNVAFVAGQRVTIVIAPPQSGTTPRSFLVASC